MTDTYTVLGVFTDETGAEEAIKELEANDFNPKNISIVMKDKHAQQAVADNTGTNVAGGALSGATTGAVVGGLAGLLAGTIVPGLGGFLIGGPIGAALGLTGAAASTISGAATGAVAGGLIGALTGLGVPEPQARVYEDKVNSGGILVVVPASHEQVEEVKGILADNAATEVTSVAAHTGHKHADA